jgi:RNA polymerase sigma-70 factor (ECF subfamily)
MFKPPGHFRLRGLRLLSDEDLVGRVQDGDPLAFEVIFDRHGGAAFSLAYRMCGRRSVAEDVVQDAFLSLWRRGRGFDPARGSVRSWVLGAVRNKALDFFRSEAAKTSRDVSDDQAVAELTAPERTEAAVEQLDDAHQVRGALMQLPDEQRRVIELSYFGGFTHSEIATMLELPAGTVKGRMRLGLTKLRLSLAEPSGNAGLRSAGVVP